MINITSIALLHLSLVRPDKQGEVLTAHPNNHLGLLVESLAAELLSLQHEEVCTSLD